MRPFARTWEMLRGVGNANPVPVVEEYEPRLLYSADVAPDALVLAGSTQVFEQRVLASDGEFTQSATDVQVQRHEIVFVDTATPDYQKLIEDIQRDGHDGRTLEVVMIDGRSDGVQQITEILAARKDVSAMHIISHGADGVVYLGQRALDSNFIAQNEDQIVRWGAALTEDADLLIYGCDVAATPEGRALMDALAELTRADVAASTNVTGHAALGGDWDLEYRIGAIEAHFELSREAQEEWFHLLLTDTVLVSYEQPFTDLGDNAYEVKSDQSWGQTFVYDSAGPTYEVDKIALVLYRSTGGSAQTVTVSLQSTWGGADIASGTIARSSLGTTEAWETVNLATPATLNDNQTYFIRVTTSSPAGGVYVGVHDAGTYTPGALINGGGVPEGSKDMVFRIIDTTVNGAPLLAGANNLGAINEDPLANPGTLVSALIAGQVSDVDAGALSGIAVTAVDNTNGAWQFSTDGGGTWTAFGSPTAASARLLAADANTSVRFVPNANFNGTVTNGLTFRAWDQTSGVAGATADATTNGGGTAFSATSAST
ncbi:MAG: DUF4347 domain-containing protein, partial [Betaproteobacteria bacterium]|nr:DUF4347 domain-containing protein [Betaproteobacteria bacterium]